MNTDHCRRILQDACEECESNWIALSGGLDSSIIANLMKKERTHAITIITKDFVGTDLTYAQIMAKHARIPLSLMHIELEKVLESINETVKILGNFNDIEIRNSVVPYIYLKSLKDNGIDSVVTGDGADEIFAGYNFLLKKSEQEIIDELERIKKIMHFPSKEIGDSLNMKVEMPFLNEKVIEFSESIQISEKINTKDGKRFGKWILRDSFDKEIPKSIIWREKSPMQDGSGTANLTNLFNSIITDEIFNQKRNEILEKDGVYIRTKESLYYYECFRKKNSVMSSNSENKCPDCNYQLNENSRFCRMCGKFPIV
tara:strand:+ start:2321 stop:3262 length:942 start_codon:yes stop_codon:yes gene_type:complete